MFGRLANVSKFAPIWKTSTSSLFEDHLRRKRFIHNFSQTLPGVSLELVNFRSSKIQQFFQRLFALSTKRPVKSSRIAVQKREKILSLLSLLLDPAFQSGKLLKPINEIPVDHTAQSISIKNEIVSFISTGISSKVLYPSLSAQALAGYIRRQMSSPQKLKDLDFRVNLKTGISMLAAFLFKRFPLGSSIRGLRIVCSGR